VAQITIRIAPVAANRVVWRFSWATFILRSILPLRSGGQLSFGVRQPMNARVRRELSAISPLDEVERAHLADALLWVDSGEPLFRTAKPATPPKHLVSYFAVVSDRHILLVDHKNAQLWLPTGGHVEPHEDPRVTVVRELREELGISVPIEAVGPPLMVTVTATVGLTAGHTDVSLWYKVVADRDARITFDPHEFYSTRWFSFSEVPLHRSDPHLGRFITKLQAALVPAA
jgi:8-oxo-dGTP diphosphatase